MVGQKSSKAQSVFFHVFFLRTWLYHDLSAALAADEFVQVQ